MEAIDTQKVKTVNVLRYISVFVFLTCALISAGINDLCVMDLVSLVLGAAAVFFTVWYNKISGEDE